MTQNVATFFPFLPKIWVKFNSFGLMELAWKISRQHCTDNLKRKGSPGSMMEFSPMFKEIKMFKENTDVIWNKQSGKLRA